MVSLLEDKLALNQNLRAELGDSGFVNEFCRVFETSVSIIWPPALAAASSPFASAPLGGRAVVSCRNWVDILRSLFLRVGSFMIGEQRVRN